MAEQCPNTGHCPISKSRSKLIAVKGLVPVFSICLFALALMALAAVGAELTSFDKIEKLSRAEAE